MAAAQPELPSTITVGLIRQNPMGQPLAAAAQERVSGADTRSTEKGQAILRLARIYLANHLCFAECGQAFSEANLVVHGLEERLGTIVRH